MRGVEGESKREREREREREKPFGIVWNYLSSILFYFKKKDLLDSMELF